MNQFNPRRASNRRKHPSRGSSPRGFQGSPNRSSFRGSQKRRGPNRNRNRGRKSSRFNKKQNFGKKQTKFYAVLAEGGLIFTEWKACELYIRDKEKKQNERIRYKSFPVKTEAENWLKSDGKKFYAVFKPDGTSQIFTDWNKCQQLINKLKQKKFKAFPTEEDAKAWISNGGKPPKKFYAVINLRDKNGGVIRTEWKQCQAYMKKMQKNRGQRVKYKSFASESEAKQWLSVGGLVFKTMKTLETKRSYHVSWKTQLIQRYKLIPKELLQSLMINVNPRMRGEGNKMVNNKDPMQYSALMGVFIDFLMMREVCIQKQQPFVAKAARLSLEMFTPYMIRYDRSVEIRNESDSDTTSTQISLEEPEEPDVEEGDSDTTQILLEEPKSKPAGKRIVGHGLERNLLHQFSHDVEKQFTDIVAEINAAITIVEDLTKANSDVLNQALMLCQFENVARNEDYDPKEIDLNFHYINPILEEITKMLKYILENESKNGPVKVQPDLSSKTTTAECDFIIGDTIFDFKCLFSITAPMMSMERSLIQYLLYAAMANDPANDLNKNYGPIKTLVILLPIQKQIIQFDLTKVPFEEIRKAFYL